MNSFSYFNPVKLVYGPGVLSQVGKEILHLVDVGASVLVVYGGGSVKRTGVLDRVLSECRNAGFRCIERGGVRPNPTVEFVRETIEIIRREKIDAVLAIGGGSVIDTAKASVLGEAYEGDVWDYFCGKANKAARLPIATVLTIPAAGSEQSARCVISNGDIKNGAGSESMNIRPRVSIVDPTVFMTLSQRQMAAGVSDMMSHVFERYFTNTKGVEFTTEECEGALRVTMQSARRLKADWSDLESWEQIGLVGSFAHCGFFGMGHEEDWACHAIEHALSGWNPSIVHGEGLAVLTPAWMQYVWKHNPERFVRFARYVMGVTGGSSQAEVVTLAIGKLRNFYSFLGLPRRLAELVEEDIPYEKISELATHFGSIGHFSVLQKEDVCKILKSA